MGKLRNEQIVMAVISHKTNKEAAEALHLSESQLYERMNTTEYRDLLNNTIMGQLERVAGELRDKLTVAIKVISEIAEDEDTPASIRLAAANSLMAHYGKLASAARGARSNVDSDKRDDTWNRLMSL